MSYPTNPDDAVVRPTYLRNITQALYLDSNSNVTVRTGVSGPVSTTVIPNPAQTTAFDEMLAIPITPVIQGDAIYGLDPDVWSTTTLNGGSVTASNSTWQVATGTSAGGYARLRTSRFLRYRPGQGAMARWTASFDVTGTTKTATGYTGMVQVSGPIGREDGFAIGYSGDAANPTIGIQHRYAGKTEIQTLSITTAPTGAQTATVTLNGIAYTVAIVAGTTAETAKAIATGLNLQTAGQLWEIQACSNTVTFSYYAPGPKTGTYLFSSTGTGTLAAGSYVRTQAGVAPTDIWTYVNNWNGTPVNFDPSKLNVFALDFRWLGAGRIRFLMEDTATGNMVLIHTIIWSSTSTVPHLTKPNLPIAYRIGSTTGATPPKNLIMRGASVMAGIEGIINQTTSSEAWYHTDATSRAKDLVWHLFSIQNPYVRLNQSNGSQLVIQDLSVAAQGSDPSTVFIVLNAAGTTTPLLFQPIPGPVNSRIFAQYSATLTNEDLSLDNPCNVETLGVNGAAQFNLTDFNFSLAPGDTISVFITSSAPISRTTTSLTWKTE